MRPGIWKQSFLVTAVTLLFCAPAVPGDILDAEVAHADGRYQVSFDVLINADKDRTWALMTDYERLPRLSRTTTESRVLERQGDRLQRLRLTQRVCILFLCKDMRKTVHAASWNKNDIVVVADPTASDFRFSVEHWRVTARDGRTRVQYAAVVEPDFFVPPLIGPWLIKSVLRREIEATLQRLESLAAE